MMQRQRKTKKKNVSGRTKQGKPMLKAHLRRMNVETPPPTPHPSSAVLDHDAESDRSFDPDFVHLPV
jgi:hypothetical protein